MNLIRPLYNQYKKRHIKIINCHIIYQLIEHYTVCDFLVDCIRKLANT